MGVSINGYISFGKLLEEYTGYAFVLELQELYSASPSRQSVLSCVVGKGQPWKQQAEGLLLTSCLPFELHM